MSSVVLLTIIVCECLFPFSIEKSKFPYWEFIGRELPILEHLKRSKIWGNPLSEDWLLAWWLHYIFNLGPNVKTKGAKIAKMPKSFLWLWLRRKWSDLLKQKSIIPQRSHQGQILGAGFLAFPRKMQIFFLTASCLVGYILKKMIQII